MNTHAKMPLPRQALVRSLHACMAAGLAEGAQKSLARRYGDDAPAAMLLKAATSPATMSDESWAGVLASSAVADFISNLGADSAASTLFASAMQIELARYSEATIPAAIRQATGAFVPEGGPIPVLFVPLLTSRLTPHKLAVGFAATNETLERSDAEQVMETLMREGTGLSLDAAFFSDAAGTETAPAGLLNGATVVTPTAGGGEAAQNADIRALAAAIAPVSGGTFTLIGSPDVALALQLRNAPLPIPVLTTSALPAGTLAAYAHRALAVSIDPTPEIIWGEHAAVHLDTAPSQISMPGTPATVSAPVQSAFQSDLSFARMILRVSWTQRASGAVAIINGVSW